VVAFRALTAHTKRSAEKLTRWTPAFADEALIATGAFVNRVRREQPLSPEAWRTLVTSGLVCR
jgi:hypothetical protein